VQQANLIKRIDAIYPPLAVQAQISGQVRFTVIIGKDGTLQNIQLISGHPLLLPSPQGRGSSHGLPRRASSGHLVGTVSIVGGMVRPSALAVSNFVQTSR